MWSELTDETKDGILYGLQLQAALRRNPQLRRRNEQYNEAVRRAKKAAAKMELWEVINALKANCPSYITELLLTEDQRFGMGSLAERYARTFWKDYLEE